MTDYLSPLVAPPTTKSIECCIYEVRGQQVMLDSDIAGFFQVEPRIINQQMKRNVERFPDDFCFQLNSREFKNLRSQNVTFNSSTKGRKYPPYLYTEHGVMALAGVLKTDIAAKMSIEIVRKFIQMRKFVLENGDVLLTLARLQHRQLEFENETNRRFEEVFRLIEKADLPKEAVFFSGQFFDAVEFINSLVLKAEKTILLVDPYCDVKALSFLKHKKDGVSIRIINGPDSKLQQKEINAFSAQYGPISVKTMKKIHDRFLILDDETSYSLGTSLNHVGKKLFSIHKIEDADMVGLLRKKFIGG